MKDSEATDSHRKITYTFTYELERDIWNWYYGVNYSDQVKQLDFTDDKAIAAKIKGVSSLEEATPILQPFLQAKIKNPNSRLNQFIQTTKTELAKKFQAGCAAIEDMTGKPLAVTNFTFYVTSFPRMVVFYDEGIIFLYSKIDNELWGMPMDGVLHELQHFQINKYWRQNPASRVAKLNEDQYFELKESLTVILDEELEPIITLPDCSYPQFKELRKVLHAHWKKYHNFDRLVDFGTDFLLQKAH